ncbi:uncharacterized protein LOC124281131 [Haliotis rubra]|uniref:uncharacterized protein LOC124281131 n=1 Tax=Haliotis rubra TaxID=36100 RepID=UPI001EE5703D|nr:uncharacterized protein LOC124281131 [Haliotis rubra]XP_046573108.1 uncharacterized protein LOC124281131 [Haliotis rubra]
MALFRKILPRSVMKRNSKDSLTSDSSTSLVSDDNTDCKVAQTDDSVCDIIDIFIDDIKYDDKRGDLNSRYSLHRRRDRKLSRMKHGLLEMDSEMKELQRMLTRTEAEIKAVEGEAKEKLQELENVLKRVDVETEVEVKKKEPLLFKKYTNLKTSSDCKSLIRTVRQKHRALQHLELLVYRKYVKFQHGGIPSPDKPKAKMYSLLPVKPMRLKPCKTFSGSKDLPEGMVFVEIEDLKSPDNLRMDLTVEDEDMPLTSYDVPLETEV